jgi:cephalosporin hydroxylase
VTAIVVDRAACVAQFGNWRRPMLKHADDLARYREIVAATRPQVIVETGTNNGASARWLSTLPGVELVITVDIRPKRRHYIPDDERITWITADSAAPETVRRIARQVAGKRVMVCLDSDHSEDHVRNEIDLYRDLVSPGCYLVVEDAVIDWLPSPKPHGCDVFTGNIHNAIEQLRYDGRYERDLAIEAMTPVTMFPSGWWIRRA